MALKRAKLANNTERNNGDNFFINIFNKNAPMIFQGRVHLTIKLEVAYYGKAWNSLTLSSNSPAIIAFEFLSLRKIIGCEAITGLRESSIAFVITP